MVRITEDANAPDAEMLYERSVNGTKPEKEGCCHEIADTLSDLDVASTGFCRTRPVTGNGGTTTLAATAEDDPPPEEIVTVNFRLVRSSAPIRAMGAVGRTVSPATSTSAACSTTTRVAFPESTWTVYVALLAGQGPKVPCTHTGDTSAAEALMKAAVAPSCVGLAGGDENVIVTVSLSSGHETSFKEARTKYAPDPHTGFGVNEVLFVDEPVAVEFAPLKTEKFSMELPPSETFQ